MGTYSIGEVAERSGFSASALRYYEDIGLVEPAGRSEAGYRIYDDRTLSRLAFVARAKRLGCSLEEIADLASLWDGEECAPVQRRLHELVTAKIGDTRRQLAELGAFATQLEHAAGQLAGTAVDGPCAEGCACAGESVESVESVEPASELIACTLTADAVDDRLADWRSVLGHARSQVVVDGGRRVVFDGAVDTAALMRLVVAERGCCSFFDFAITVDGRGVALEVRAPAGAGEIVDAVFGPLDGVAGLRPSVR